MEEVIWQLDTSSNSESIVFKLSLEAQKTGFPRKGEIVPYFTSQAP